MNKTKLVFSSDEESVRIVFANGSESIYFESKEEAICAIRDCRKKGKISDYEEESFIKDILLSSKLPTHNKKVFMLPLIFLASILDVINEVLTKDSSKIDNPYVEICNCNHKRRHAYIHNGNGDRLTPPLQFKSEGLGFTEYFFRTEKITEGDRARLATLIELLPLPESPLLN